MKCVVFYTDYMLVSLYIVNFIYYFKGAFQIFILYLIDLII